MKAIARFFSFVVFIFFLQTVLVSVSAAAARIMPLGDSITRGSSSGELDENRQVSYRKALWDKLIAAGYDVDFVGSLNAGSALFADPDHEGHSGWQDDEIAAFIYGWLELNSADIILLHIGTNGLDSSPDDVALILDEIDRYEADYITEITVVLARIINRIPYSGTTTLFNNNVEVMANARVNDSNNPAYPDKIVFGQKVDMEDEAGIIYDYQPSGDMYDYLHPYQDPTTGEAPGYEKMADVWFSALEEILPVADFTADPISGEHPLTVNFTDQSTGDITSWSWDFGDGLGTSTQQNPSYTYNDPGTYTVRLTVTGPAGTDTETKTDYVVVDYIVPIANFAADPTRGPAPLTVDYTEESTGDITSWFWNFGDGSTSTSTEQNPTYIYNNAGTYTVSLTVTGPNGTDIATKDDYIVIVIDPVANFTADPISGEHPLAVNFTDQSTGNITSWSWDFGDGLGTSTQQNASYTYNDPGTYTVRLTVTGPGGTDTLTETDYITVSNPTDGGGGGGCFISTATHGLCMGPHVKVPQEFRDYFLHGTFVGRTFVDLYHSIRYLCLISTLDVFIK